MSKHDVVIMELRVDGRFIGWLTRPRTARQAFEERIECATIRKQWREMIESSKQVWQVPVFGVDDGKT